MSQTSSLGAPASRRERTFVMLTLVGLALYVVISILLGILRPEESLIADFESYYGRGRFAWLMDIAFVVRGLLTATALVVLVRRGIARWWTGVLFALWALSSVLLAFFPTDEPGYPDLPAGVVHTALAGGGFLAAAIAVLGMSIRIIRRRAAARGTAVGLLVVAALSIVFFLGQGLAPALALAGLNERLFLACILVWTGWAAVSTRSVANPQAVAPIEPQPLPAA